MLRVASISQAQYFIQSAIYGICDVEPSLKWAIATMPTIQAQGKTFDCEVGTNLRQALLQHDVAVHNAAAKVINCRGLGTCGTCAVQIEGTVAELGWREQTRLSLPPHSPAKQRRLCCQLQVVGNLKITKYDGFWGQGDQVVWTPEQASALNM